MILLYRKTSSRLADEIEARLNALVLAYRVVLMDEQGGTANEPTPRSLPAIEESGRRIGGRRQISAYLDELEMAVEEWRRFQTDACYLDEEGETC